MSHTCPAGHKTQFRGCSVCMALKLKIKIKRVRLPAQDAGLVKARASRKVRGNYRPVPVRKVAA